MTLRKDSPITNKGLYKLFTNKNFPLVNKQWALRKVQEMA